MSKEAEERILKMRFDNAGFEKAVQTTLGSLQALSSGVKNCLGTLKGFAGSLDFSRFAPHFDMSSVEGSIIAVSDKFSALGVIGVTALQNITNSAVDTGKKIAESLTVEPIRSGFQEYETQMNAVQTIFSNVKDKGKTLDDVNKALDELNHYADLTIYNFTEMTRNIGTFTAAGVDLDKSVSSIKGIANLAAMSGSTSQQASTAMYQLSQALASGTVKLQDWNSVVNAGMGGQLFQDALKKTAKSHGVAIDAMIQKEGSFRETLKNGWLTADILTETLNGFATNQDAIDAATKVKTVTQLIDTLKEAMQSGWTRSWQLIIGDFEEARNVLTEISDVLNKVVGDSADARNKILEDWQKLGGRDSLINAFKNILASIINISGSVKKTLSSIFPKITAERLALITKKIETFSEKLKKMTEEGGSVFKKLSSMTGKGSSVIKKITDTVESIVPTVKKTLDSVYSSVKNLLSFVSGTFFKNIDSAIKNGSAIIEKAGNYVSDAASLIKKVLSNISETINGLFDSLKKRSSENKESIKDVISQIKESDFVSHILSGFTAVSEYIKTTVSAVSEFVKGFVKLGGAVTILDSVKNIFTGLARAARIAIEAFIQVFPPIELNADAAYSLAEKFKMLTERFAFSDGVASRLKNTFVSVFTAVRSVAAAVIPLIKSIAKLAVSMLPTLISAFAAFVNVAASFIRAGISIASAVIPAIASAFSGSIGIISSGLQTAAGLAGSIIPQIISMVSKAVNGIIRFVGQFSSMGGLTSAAGAVKNAFASVVKILGILKKSFRSVFPEAGSGAAVLYRLVEAFRKLTGEFVKSDKAADILGRVFTGTFSLISSGIKIISSIKDNAADAVKSLGGFKQVFGSLGTGNNFFAEIGPAISKAVSSISDFVREFSELGGFTVILETIRDAIKAVITTAGAVKDAFSEIFSGTGSAAEPVYRIAEVFRKLIDTFNNSESAADNLKRIFKGVFAFIDIGVSAFKAFIGSVTNIAGDTAPIGESILGIAANIGDFIVKIDEAIKSSDIFNTGFEKIIGFVKKLVSALLGAGGDIRTVLDSFTDGFEGLREKLGPILLGIWDLVKTTFTSLASVISDTFTGMDIGTATDIFNTGFFAALVISVKSLIDKFKELADGGGMFSHITDLLDGARSALESWQTSLNIGMIKQIATSVAILAGSLILLAMVDEEKLESSLAMVTAMLGEMIGMLAAFKKILDGANVGDMTKLSGLLLGISVAVLILTSSVMKLSALSWEELAKGLTGVTVILGEMIGVIAAFSKIADMSGFEKISSISGMLILMSAAVLIFSAAVKNIASLSWEELAKGISGTTAILGEMIGTVAAFSKIGGTKGMLSTAVGLVIIGGAVLIFGKAVENMGSLSWEQIGKGLLTMAAALAEVTAAVNFMPANMVSIGVGLAAVSAAVLIMSSAIQKMGGMTWEEIGKGLLSMAAALTAMVIALNAASGGIGGAAAMVVMAAAINMLTPSLMLLGRMPIENVGKSLLMIAGVFALFGGMGAVVAAFPNIISGMIEFGGALIVMSVGINMLTPALMALGSMPIENIGKSLLMLAGMFAVIGVAAAVLQPIIPAILTLGAAITFVGFGVDLLGAGIALLAAGFTALFAVIESGAAVLAAALPPLISAMLAALLDTDFLEKLSLFCRKILDIVKDILIKLFEIVRELVPEIADVALDMVLSLLQKLEEYLPLVIDCGMKLLTGLLRGISDNIGEIVKAAVDIVINFIEGIASKMDDIVQAGWDLLIAFIDGITLGINNNQQRLKDSLKALGDAIVNGLGDGLKEGIIKIKDRAAELGDAAVTSIKDFLGIHSPSKVFDEIGRNISEGFANGISGSSFMAGDAGKNLGDTAVSSMSSAFSQIGELLPDSMDMSPTITPVVDMTNVQNEAKDISGLLNDASNVTGTISVSARPTLTASRSYETSQKALAGETVNSNITVENSIKSGAKDICDQMGKLNASEARKLDSILSRMNKLEDAITKMQVVLDSGELVGAMSSKMDEALGFKAAIAGRTTGGR